MIQCSARRSRPRARSGRRSGAASTRTASTARSRRRQPDHRRHARAREPPGRQATIAGAKISTGTAGCTRESASSSSSRTSAGTRAARRSCSRASLMSSAQPMGRSYYPCAARRKDRVVAAVHSRPPARAGGAMPLAGLGCRCVSRPTSARRPLASPWLAATRLLGRRGDLGQPRLSAARPPSRGCRRAARRSSRPGRAR
jgi:hypothetical protein